MPDLNLLIDHEDEIQVPIALLSSPLSQDEIFALLVFMAMAKQPESAESLSQRLAGATPERTAAMKTAGTTLQQKGIIAVGVKGNNVSIQIDLDAALAEHS